MKSRIVTYFFFVTGLICFLASCGNRNVLSRDEMTDVLYDVQLAQAIYQFKYNDFVSVDAKDALLAGVLEKHNITEAQFDSSLVWYSDNAEIMMKINDSVKSRLQGELFKIEKGKGGKTGLIPQFAILDISNPTFYFNLNKSSVSDLGSSPIWSFSTLGVSPQTKILASISYNYADTTIVKQQEINSDILYSLSENHSAELNNVSGYIHLDLRTYTSQITIYNQSIRKSDISDATLQKEEKGN